MRDKDSHIETNPFTWIIIMIKIIAIGGLLYQMINPIVGCIFWVLCIILAISGFIRHIYIKIRNKKRYR